MLRGNSEPSTEFEQSLEFSGQDASQLLPFLRYSRIPAHPYQSGFPFREFERQRRIFGLKECFLQRLRISIPGAGLILLVCHPVEGVGQHRNEPRRLLKDLTGLAIVAAARENPPQAEHFSITLNRVFDLFPEVGESRKFRAIR